MDRKFVKKKSNGQKNKTYKEFTDMKLFPSLYRILIIITSKFVIDSLKKYHLCDFFLLSL
jgi:hypothetical protein